MCARGRGTKAKCPGGDWKQVQIALEGIYGKGKRTFVWRMICAAITLPQPVLDKLAACPAIPNSYIHENKYFTGQGVDLNRRISTEGRVKLLDMLQDDLESKKPMSVNVFQKEYCAVMKHVEG